MISLIIFLKLKGNDNQISILEYICELECGSTLLSFLNFVFLQPIFLNLCFPLDILFQDIHMNAYQKIILKSRGELLLLPKKLSITRSSSLILMLRELFASSCSSLCFYIFFTVLAKGSKSYRLGPVLSLLCHLTWRIVQHMRWWFRLFLEPYFFYTLY